MSENTPQLLIIPGSYISALAYYDLRDVIRKARPELPEALVYDLPSASSGPPLPAPTLDDDGAFFAEKIIQLADQGIDVVLLGHSYGGLVAREALKGLSKTERASQGKAGGVVHTIYISPIICEPGQTTMDTLAGITYDHFDVFDEVSLAESCARYRIDEAEYYLPALCATFHSQCCSPAFLRST